MSRDRNGGHLVPVLIWRKVPSSEGVLIVAKMSRASCQKCTDIARNGVKVLTNIAGVTDMPSKLSESEHRDILRRTGKFAETQCVVGHERVFSAYSE